jgi:hypothetical protein
VDGAAALGFGERLQAKGIDFEQNQIVVRDGKGMRDRATMLPEQLRNFL